MLREKIFVSCIVTSYIATIFFISKYNWLVVSIAPLFLFSLFPKRFISKLHLFHFLNEDKNDRAGRVE